MLYIQQKNKERTQNMVYEPSFCSPYLIDIDDAVSTNRVECQINAQGGTAVTAYRLSLLNASDTRTTGSKTNLSPVLYNHDALSVAWPTALRNAMTNGNDYRWQIRLYEATPNIWVTSGFVSGGEAEVSTTTNIYTRNHYNVEASS